MNNHNRAMWMRIVKIGLLVALVILAVWHLDLEAFARALSPRLLFAAVLIQPLIVLGLLAVSARFRALLGRPETRLVFVAKAQVLSLGMNALLPARIAEILKVTYLRDHASVTLAVGCAAVLLERLIDISFLGTLAALSVILLVAEVNLLVIGLATAAVACMVALPLLEPLAMRIARSVPFRAARDLTAAIVQQASQRYRERAVLKGMLFGVAVWSIGFANMCVFFAVATGGTLGPSQILAVFVASLIGVAVPALPGGFGTFEAAVAFVLVQFGFALEEALAMAIVLHAAELAPFVAGALAISLRERLGIESLVRDGARALRASD